MSDISKYTTVETKGWKHEYSDRLFNTKEEADYDWAITTFRMHVDESSTYNEFDIGTFLERIKIYETLRGALSVLGMYQINYPR